MTAARTMVRGGVFSSAGTMISMAGTLGAAMIFTRMLPETDVGVFVLMIVACDMFVLLNNLGMRSALPKLVAGAPDEQRGVLIGSVLGFQLLISAALGVVVFAAWLFIDGPAQLSQNPSWANLFPYLWLLPLFFLLGTQRDMTMAAMAGLDCYGRRAAGLAVGAGTNVFLVATLVWWLRGGLMTLFLATLASYAAVTLWEYANLPAGRRLRLDWNRYREAVGFSWPLYANNILTFVFQRIDTLLIAALSTPATVAYYEMAKRIPIILSRFLNSGLIPYLPGISSRIAKGDIAGAGSMLNVALPLAAVLGYSATLAIVLIQKPLILLLFSDKYIPALEVLWLLLTGFCVMVQTGILGFSLIGLGKPLAVTIINTVTALSSLGANVLLIPRFGIVGAGAVFLAAMVFSNVMHIIAVQHRGLRVALGKYLATQFFMVLALLLAIWAGGPIWRLAALCLFPGLCFGARVITPAQVRTMLSALAPSTAAKGNAG